jgi:hypothetical protein
LEKILTISTSEKENIRKKLLDAVNNSTNGAKAKKDYPSEIHNTQEVPFEGSIYNNENTRISSSEIKKMYAKHTPSLFWVILHSLMAPAYKIAR